MVGEKLKLRSPLDFFKSLDLCSRISHRILHSLPQCCGSGSYGLGLWIRIRHYSVRIRILSSTSKKCKKNLLFLLFYISFRLFIYENWCKCTKKEISKIWKKTYFLLTSCQPLTKKAGSGSGSGSVIQRYGSATLLEIILVILMRAPASGAKASLFTILHLNIHIKDKVFNTLVGCPVARPLDGEADEVQQRHQRPGGIRQGTPT